MREGARSPQTKGQPGIGQAALFGLCPHCHARTLFAAPAQVAGECSACGLELAALERGGRLAGLLTIATAFLLMALAFALDEMLRPPIWLHVLLWAPLTVLSVLGVLRLFKAAGVYRQYARIEQGPGE